MVDSLCIVAPIVCGVFFVFFFLGGGGWGGGPCFVIQYLSMLYKVLQSSC